VATVAPYVSISLSPIASNATTLTISGYGFDATPGNNMVSLDGATAIAASGVSVGSGGAASSLTVSLPGNLPAGSLTAVVTADGASNSSTQVATVVPAVTSSQTSIASNTATLTISGYGFDATAGNNMVSLNGATAIAASSVSVGSGGAASSLHVTLPGNLPVGSLTAVVTTDTTYSSGPAVQVATITPGVPVNQATIASNATTLTISGYGFDATPGNNMVSLDGAAAIAASSVSVGSGGAASSLTVSLPGNLPAGSLTAVVTTDTTYSSGPAVQVATVAPYVTPNTSNPVPANTATLTITGYGFDSTAANNTVAFNGGTPIAASRFTAGSGGAASSLQVTLPGTLTAGNLMVVVMTHGVSSSSTQVATLTPVVTSSSATVALNATSVVINGYGFDPAKANDSVQFNGVAAGTVTAATANSLTVTFGTKPAATGSLTAIVTTGTQNSGSAVPVATVVAAVTVPTVTNGATTTLLANANSLTITGSGFDAVATNNRLSFNDGAVGTVTGVNSGKTALTVQLTTLPTTAGALSASVITDGVSSGAAVQVATVKPVVSSSGAALGINATQLTINGFGFDPTKGNDSVTLYSGGSLTGVSATITGTPTATSLTVTPPAGMALGNLTAAVTVDTESSGTAVQVATVRPVVTASAASVAVGASGMTISGFGFSTTATSNVLSFNNGVTGTVSSSTANTLNVTFGSVKPTTLGPLTVTVSTGGIADSSATPVTVGTVVPVVTLNSGGTPVLGANQITISGSGFDPANNGANNSVQFNLGVTGTVTAGTATSLTVTFNSNGKPALAGNLTATVTTDTSYVSSTTQVATIAPTVTRNTSNPLPANTTSITLGGSGFDPNGTNTVSLNGGTPITATNVTGTSLQVALPSTLTAGNLMVVVTTNGAASTSTQVATLTPVVNSNTSNPLAANAGTLTIGGSGFDTVKTNDTVTLYSGGSLTGVTATITGTPTSTSISVTPPAGMAVGNLTAKVAVGSQNSGTIPVQVATVVPAVTANLSNPLALGASQVTISGAGFDTASNGVNNSVQFNLGVTGTVSAATATSLTVTLNNKPAIAGNLTATVTTDNSYVSNTAQVATIAPTVNSNASNPLPANTASITISGSGFASSGTNTVSLNGGTPIAATNVTGTSLQVALPTTLTAGNLMVVVTTNGVASTSMQVATLTPVVTGSQADLPCGATSMVINGFGFDATTAHDTLAFNNGVSGTVSSATANTLNVTFGASAKPTTGGSLTVTVITDQQSSGITPVQVATVVPVITSSNATLAFNSSTVTIGGTGFSATKSSDIVTLDGVAATVNTASTTSLQVALPAGLTVGNLMTVVTIGTASSTSTQVATLTPVVTGGTPSTLALGASSITINGFGFDTTNNGAHNTVQFNLGVTGQVSAATANTLTVTLNNKPATAGDLTAIVTTDTSYSSGTTGVQVATIAPSVTGNTNNKLAANAATVTINGSGFSTTLTLNSVKLNGVTAAINSGSASQLVVAIPAGLSAGNLMAVVTSNGVAGSSTQVATLTPVVTPKTTSVAHTVATLTIYGYGFDTTTASNNTVVFTFSTGATVTGHVIAATAATSSAAGTLTVTYDTKPTTAGTLSAVVTTDLSYSSAATPVVVATIT
jgi:RNase P/RNase MRP subunit p29